MRTSDLMFCFFRSFDEDRTRVRARLLAPGIPPLGLTPWPRLPFEQVIAHGLAATGPVVGINQPGTSLPRLGAAKETLDDSQWRGRISELASDAIAVVLLGTPSSVSDEGYGWEIDLLARQVPHNRLVVVLGPYGEADRSGRWGKFLRFAERVPAMAALEMLNPPGAVRVAVRSAGRGWEFYADDAAYLSAIGAAVRSMRRAWIAELAEQTHRDGGVAF